MTTQTVYLLIGHEIRNSIAKDAAELVGVYATLEEAVAELRELDAVKGILRVGFLRILECKEIVP